MTDDNPNEAYEVVPGPLPQQTVAVAFLVSASELRDRKRRRKHDLANRSEAIRRLVEFGLKAKGK
jgi:hypothetical protein